MKQQSDSGYVPLLNLRDAILDVSSHPGIDKDFQDLLGRVNRKVQRKITAIEKKVFADDIAISME